VLPNPGSALHIPGVALDGSIFGPGQPCFGCGPDHPIGFRLAFEREGDEIVTRFVPGDRHQGPPGIMHGGLVTTLADEIAAWAVIALLGKFGFTAAMSCKLHKPVRVGVPLVGRGSLVRDSGRIVQTRARIVQEDTDMFTGDFTFAILDRAGAEKMLGGPLPEAWNQFAR
jgi:acyl-coenzyme A thioesterase PaaI-like protein